MMIMPPVVQNLIARYGWRTSMFVLGIAVLGMYALAALLTRKEPQMMGLLPYGATTDNDASDTRDEISRSTIPPQSHSTLKEAIKTKELWLLVGMFCSFAVSVQMVTSHVVRYALDVGISAEQAPLIVSIIGGGGMVGKIVAGALSERIGPRRIIIICASVMAGTVIWLSNMTNIWTFFTFAVPFGLAYGGWVPNISILVAEIFGTAHYGEIWATARVGGGLGGIVGPMLAGYVFDITDSYRAALWSGAGITLLAIMFAVLLRKRASV
jgi:MFS family permease